MTCFFLHKYCYSYKYICFFKNTNQPKKVRNRTDVEDTDVSFHIILHIIDRVNWIIMLNRLVLMRLPILIAPEIDSAGG